MGWNRNGPGLVVNGLRKSSEGKCVRFHQVHGKKADLVLSLRLFLLYFLQMDVEHTIFKGGFCTVTHDLVREQDFVL